MSVYLPKGSSRYVMDFYIHGKRIRGNGMPHPGCGALSQEERVLRKIIDEVFHSGNNFVISLLKESIKRHASELKSVPPIPVEAA